MNERVKISGHAHLFGDLYTFKYIDPCRDGSGLTVTKSDDDNRIVEFVGWAAREVEGFKKRELRKNAVDDWCDL